MTFIPPAFSILRVNTLNLEAKLSTLLDRYKIIDNTTPPAAGVASQNSLEVLIARANQVIQCKTSRTKQREVFEQLVRELREVLKEGDEEKNKQGAMFLLGSLIHRYFRLISEYANYGYGFWGLTSVTSCDLFQAIRAALQFDIRELKHIEKDLKILDATTIVTALEVFRDNMLVKDKHQVPRYKNYPHFAQDENFVKYLQEIIDQYSDIGLQALTQFKAVRFVQSLAKQLELEHQQIEEELKKWSQLLIAEHPDFSKVNSEILDAHIRKNVKVDLVRIKIIELLHTPRIQYSLEKSNHITFLADMNSCQLDIASYTVFGGYSLLLQSKGVDEKLKFCIHQALGIEKKPLELTQSDMLLGITFLKQYEEDNPQAVLDCTFFGGREKLKTHILQKELHLLNIENGATEKTEKTEKTVSL